jgi:hypothetical protein
MRNQDGLRTGCCPTYSAATPETKGAAIDVPVLGLLLVSEVMIALTMFTPGAWMSKQGPLSHQSTLTSQQQEAVKTANTTS